MPDVIHLLPDSVANQIAAGEVIQRPASVVKELVENSLDAGATRIEVLVTDAGKTCIQIVDNGCGMSDTDARLAFERHATSKIRGADDLFSLRTMGFRGEALPSVAAVAQVELRTRKPESKLGVSISIEGSRVTAQQPVACDAGANFMVRNLFFNIPARRRFLKSNQTEFANIVTEFEKIALARPDVRFLLHNNGEIVHSLAAGSFLQRICDIFGKRMNQQLLHIAVDTSIVRISGFVGTPESARKKGARQFFFVNSRFMRHPYLGKAVAMAYERLIPPDTQTPYFVCFDIDPARIDVNIHPTKTEIKFDDEQAVFQILLAAVREAVGKFNAVPQLDFSPDSVSGDIPAYNPGDRSPAQPRVSLAGDYNPFALHPQPAAAPREWQSLFEATANSASATRHTSAPEPFGPSASPFEGRALEHYQFKNRYVVTAVRSGLMIIDQHRAHVRILYERFLKRLSGRRSSGERLIFPEPVSLSPSETATLASIADGISAAGFELSDLGDGNFAINALPSGAEKLNPAALLRDVLAETAAHTSVKHEIDRHIALALATRAAIPYGSTLDNAEMNHLIDALFATGSPKFTPDGKTVVAILPQEQIEGLFP